jgi:glycerol-3-phosphate dehydrogenase
LQEVKLANPLFLIAVAFLKYMGLPKPMLSATRKQVEQGKLDFANSLEWNMYSRHDKPQDD